MNRNDKVKTVDNVGFVLTKADGSVHEIKPQLRMNKQLARDLLVKLLLARRPQS